MDESWQSICCRQVRSSNEPKTTEQEHAKLENRFVADCGGVDGADFRPRTGDPILHTGLQHFGGPTDHSDVIRPDVIGRDGYYYYGSHSYLCVWALHNYRNSDRPTIGNATEDFV